MVVKLINVFRQKNAQGGQGMVEFALVLPILLTIIMGIFAFGHLFFSYSLVVAASHEAARFGATVGTTVHQVPRYRDCNEIREMAAQTGSYAGVEATETSVKIEYDQGPKRDPTSGDILPAVVYPDGCPVDGFGPGYLELGDRIVVTVSITYTPIVPLVPIPSFTITSVTRRTIVMGMPVGDPPVAESYCHGTVTRILPSSWVETEERVGSFSKVGEPVTVKVEVITDNPSLDAPGTVKLYIDDDTYTTAHCSGSSDTLLSCAAPIWLEVGTHTLRARYDPGIYGDETTSPCFQASKAEPMIHTVEPADTAISIVSHYPDPSFVKQEVLVNVLVKPVSPGGGTPLGPVEVSDNHGNKCSVTLLQYMPGVARGFCLLKLTTEGSNKIKAVYDPDPETDANYNTSTSDERIQWVFRPFIP